MSLPRSCIGGITADAGYPVESIVFFRYETSQSSVPLGGVITFGGLSGILL